MASPEALRNVTTSGKPAGVSRGAATAHSTLRVAPVPASPIEVAVEAAAVANWPRERLAPVGSNRVRTSRPTTCGTALVGVWDQVSPRCREAVVSDLGRVGSTVLSRIRRLPVIIITITTDIGVATSAVIACGSGSEQVSIPITPGTIAPSGVVGEAATTDGAMAAGVVDGVSDLVTATAMVGAMAGASDLATGAGVGEAMVSATAVIVAGGMAVAGAGGMVGTDTIRAAHTRQVIRCMTTPMPIRPIRRATTSMDRFP